MKRAVLIAAASVAAAAALVALSRRDRRPGSPAGSWEPVDHRTGRD